MQIKIQNGVVELSGEPILQEVNIEINDTSRIAVVGRNGCGKTTLLRLIAGEYTLVPQNKNGLFAVSGKPQIGFLSQMTFDNEERTLAQEVQSAYHELLALKEALEQARRQMEAEQSETIIGQYTSLLERFETLGGFTFQKEYEGAIRRFGFSEEEKQKKLSEFSGGQRTRIAFLKLLLSKPDLLLLDEPTNHLDAEAVQWMEEYLNSYKKAFVVVSHDRMFLDRVAKTVIEIEYGKTHRYAGNYTAFVQAKKERRAQQEKEYLAQQKERERLEQLVERFRYKPTKAAMAQSKLKQIERMKPVPPPKAYDLHTFHADFEPEDTGVRDVLSVRELGIGYTSLLSTISLEIKRGDRIAVIGGNGLGKSTFIKTLMGEIKPLSGEIEFGSRVKIGYFDQQMAQVRSKATVLEEYLSEFPGMTEFEARSALGAFLFRGDDVFKTVDLLSGGERVRLALCKIFKKRPNFLILDEPTNHMDIVGKETLEDMLSHFSGTLLFVSHDRYFVNKIAHRLLSFEKDGVHLYPYGYEQYLELKKEQTGSPEAKPREPKQKKTFTTPAKEKAKKERAIAKAEKIIAELEEQMTQYRVALASEENATDYSKLTALQTEMEICEARLDTALEEWVRLNTKN